MNWDIVSSACYNKEGNKFKPIFVYVCTTYDYVMYIVIYNAPLKGYTIDSGVFKHI